jgi:hypothetical protein
MVFANFMTLRLCAEVFHANDISKTGFSQVPKSCSLFPVPFALSPLK